MAKKTQTKKIGGNTFEVTQMPSMSGMRMLARLGRAMGGSMGEIAEAVKGAKTIMQADVGALGAAVEKLFEKLTPDEMEALINDLFTLTSTTIDGTPLLPVFDIVMQGRTLDTLVLLRFILEVSYGDFTDALTKAQPSVVNAEAGAQASKV